MSITPAELANVKLVEFAYREAAARLRAAGGGPSVLPSSAQVSVELRQMGVRMEPALVLETARRTNLVLADVVGDPEEPTRKLPAAR